MLRVAVLGGGRMGEALLGGLLNAGWKAGELSVAEVRPERRRHLEESFSGIRVLPSASWAVAEAEVVVVAVKPSDVREALRSAEPAIGGGTLVVSIAAGVDLSTLESLVPGRPVVRAMPNTPALVRRGSSAIAGGTEASEDDLARAESILGAVGLVVRVPESLLDAVTGLSGSGPAYVFLVVEALTEAGVLVGLPRDVAAALVVGTLAGSVAMLEAGGDGPEALRAAVTSPGGTTAAGLRALERAGVRAAFLDAVVEATRRSQELGRGG